MKTSILFFIFVIINCTWTQETDTQYAYSDFMRQFRRTYSGDQKTLHENIFNTNYAQVLKLTSGGSKLMINDFLDWSDSQKQKFLNYHPEQSVAAKSSPALTVSSLFSTPTSFNWKTYDRITDISNQNNCGASWAFAATAQYQSLYVIATNGTKVGLSEQYIIQCDGGSTGCNGGYPNSALNLAKTGIPLQSSYPYKSNDNFFTKSVICNQPTKTKNPYEIQQVSRFTNLTAEQLQQYLIRYGPLSVGLDANSSSFLFAGPDSTITCPSTTQINHAVLLIGYNQSHWFIKNSWGTTWGDVGIGFISKSNDCNIRSWVDVMQVNFQFNPTPGLTSPSTNSINTLNLTIQMTDSYGDGWNGNFFALQQSGGIVGIFGQNFTSGSTNGPIQLTIPANVQTQIVPYQYGANTNQIGFTVKDSSSGIILFTRAAGTNYTSNTILYDFCPKGGCSSDPNIKYYLTLTDQWGDGWSGNSLAFRQNIVLQTFDLPVGGSSPPAPFIFKKGVPVEVIVNTVGTWSNQIGFQLKTYNGLVVAARYPGTSLYPNTKIATFTPQAVNLNPVQIVSDNSNRQTVSNTDTSSDSSLNSFKVATIVLASLLFVAIIVSIIAIVKAVNSSKQSAYKTSDEKFVNNQSKPYTSQSINRVEA